VQRRRSPVGVNPTRQRVAPAGSSRSGERRQRILLKHSDEKGRVRRLSERAGRNASERRAGLETGNVGADPPVTRGRPPLVGKHRATSPTGPAGVLATACMTRRPTGTREAPAVRSVILNRRPARDRPGRRG
jgi:hypothetical protein